jgi:hypothetical protein
MEKGFTVPTGPIADLTPGSVAAGSGLIGPDDLVICINRGREVIVDKWDGRDFSMPVGLFKMPFGAAAHFQKRQIVPGTKNLEEGGYQSWIGIFGTVDGSIRRDTPELCEPYTDEQLQKFGVAVEAFDRSTGASEADRAVKPIATNAARAATLGHGPGPRGIDVGKQANADAEAAAEHVLDPPEESATRAAEAEAEGEGVAPVSQRRRR